MGAAIRAVSPVCLMQLALEEQAVRDMLALAPATLISAGKATEGMVEGLLASAPLALALPNQLDEAPRRWNLFSLQLYSIYFF